MKQVQVMLKLATCHHLSQYFCWILIRVHLHERNITFLYDIPHKMISDVDMLGTSMMNLILHQVNRTLTVAPQVHVLLVNPQIV